MPRVVIKPDRDEDFYVIWSTVTDGPLFHGDYAQTLAELPNDGSPEDSPEERMRRAQVNGSSARSVWRYGWWDRSTFLTAWSADGEHELGFRLIDRARLREWLLTGDESLTYPLDEERARG